jgi:hypothetical protein
VTKPLSIKANYKTTIMSHKTVQNVIFTRHIDDEEMQGLSLKIWLLEADGAFMLYLFLV